MAFADTQKLVVELDLKGNFNRAVKGAISSARDLDKATSRTQKSLGRFGHNIEKGVALAAGAATTGFLIAANAAGDFEAQLNTINTVAGLSSSELSKTGDSLRKIAKETGIGLDDLTSAYYDLESAGIHGALAQATLNDAVTLGIGGLATTSQTVDLLTTAINAYGLDAAGAAKATDQFALAVADGKVKADEIAASFADVASIAKTYGVGIDQIAASYAYLTAQGVPASEVTTELQRAIISIINPTKDLAKAGKNLGISWEKELRKKGVVPTLQEIATYSQKTGVPLNDLLGRIEAVKFLTQTTGPALAGFTNELDKMGHASGTAAKQMAERQKGLNFELARLKALGTDAAITIGSKLLPKLTPLVEQLDKFILGHQDEIAKFGDNLAAGFEQVATAIGKTDWQPFIDGLKITADIARGAVGAFQALPDWLQKLVIAGAVVNKVSGGLVTSLGKDIVAGLGAQFLARGASPANPLWVQMAGGLPGTGGPGAAGAAEGGVKGILTDLTKFLVVPAVILAAGAAAKAASDEFIGKRVFGLDQKQIDTVNKPIVFPQATQFLWFKIGDNTARAAAGTDLVRHSLDGLIGQTSQASVRNSERQEAIRMQVAAANASRIADSRAEQATIRSAGAASAAVIANAAKFASSGEQSAIARAASAQVGATRKAGADTASEEAAVRRAVQAKKLSVTVPVSIRTNISVRETINSQTTFKKFYSTAQ